MFGGGLVSSSTGNPVLLCFIIGACRSALAKATGAGPALTHARAGKSRRAHETPYSNQTRFLPPFPAWSQRGLISS